MYIMVLYVIKNGGNMEDKKNRTRLTVNFRDKDKELYDWIVSKGAVIGVSNAIKMILDEAKKKEDIGSK